MGKRASQNVFKGLAALGLLTLIVFTPLVLIGYIARAEHDRRVQILNTGILTSAVVTHSFKGWSSRGCVFDYRFRFNGRLYEGGDGGCALVADHPVGSELKVRVDPGDPANSVAIGSDLWPGWSIIPLLLAPPLFLVGAVGIYAVLTSRQRGHRRRRASHH